MGQLHKSANGSITSVIHEGEAPAGYKAPIALGQTVVFYPRKGRPKSYKVATCGKNPCADCAVRTRNQALCDEIACATTEFQLVKL